MWDSPPIGSARLTVPCAHVQTMWMLERAVARNRRNRIRSIVVIAVLVAVIAAELAVYRGMVA